MERWQRLKEDPWVRVTALRRDDWRKYAAMAKKLVKQLAPDGLELTERDFHCSLGQDEENFAVFIVRRVHGEGETPEGEFIGMASVFLRQILSGWIAEIHDHVVDQRYFRKGYGRLLTQHIFDYVKQRAQALGAPVRLSLTSKPESTAANAMYVQAGFELVAEAITEKDALGNPIVDPLTGWIKYKPNTRNLYRKVIYP